MKSQLLSDDPQHPKRPSIVENARIYPVSQVNTTEAQEEWDELSAAERWDELSAVSEAIYLSLPDAVPTAPLVDALVLNTYLTLHDDPLLSTDTSSPSATEADPHAHPDVIAKYVDQVTGFVDWQGVALDNQDLYGL